MQPLKAGLKNTHREERERLQVSEDIKQFINEENAHKVTLSSPKTTEELKQRLAGIGEAWREEHQKVNKKTKEIKKLPVSPRAVADILKRECTFILIDEDNPELAPLAVYDLDNGIYQKGERFINRLAMAVERTLTAQACNNIIHYLTVESEEKTPTKDKNLIVVNNGIYNRSKGILEPFSSEYVFVNKIATNFVENAPKPIFKDWSFDDWLTELADENAIKEVLLWQIFAVAINSNYISEVAVFFISEQGRTGKSTFQQLLINLVGSENTASLKIKEFESDFKLASAYGKSLIVGDDNNFKHFNETSENFKSVTTGESVLLNPKGDKPFRTVLTPFIVQSMNGLPKFNDISDGLQRRLRIVMFNHTYKGERNNRAIKEKYIYDKRLLEYILYQVISMKFDEVEDTEESKRAIHDLTIENSAVINFYETIFVDLQSTRLPMKFLFKLFQAFCENDNQPTKMKQNTFTRELRTIVERNGWQYEPKNLAPLNYLVKEDTDLLNELDTHYRYSIKIDSSKNQPLLFETQP